MKKLPLVKGGRGMFRPKGFRYWRSSPKEHPPSPLRKGETFGVRLHSHARSHTESGGDGGKHRDDDVENFAPKFFFHDD